MKYLQKDQDNVLSFIPDARPSSATFDFVYSSGGIVASPTATLDSLSRTISSVADFSFVYDNGSGTGTFTPGKKYWIVTGEEQPFLIQVSKVDGTTIYYEDKPSGAIIATSTVVGAEFTTTVLATNTSIVGLNYQLRWKVTFADSTIRTFLETAAVCRTVFNPPMTAAIAARHVGYAFPSIALNRPSDYWVDIASRASRRVETRIISSGKLPHLLGDQSLLEDAGFTSLRIELARDGLIPSGFEASSFMATAEEDLKKQLEFALSNVWHDASESGSVDESEIRGPRSVNLYRR